MADLEDKLEKAARTTAAERYARARAFDTQDSTSFRNTTDALVNFAKNEPQYAPYYREFLTRDKAPTYSLDELAAAAPAFAPKRVAAAIAAAPPSEGSSGVSTDSEAEVAKPKPPPKKSQNTNQPTQPQPTVPRPTQPQPSPAQQALNQPNAAQQALGIFSNAPEAAALMAQHATAGGQTWAETAQNHAQLVAQSFSDQPNTNTGVSIIPRGMTLPELLHYGDARGVNTVNAPGGGYFEVTKAALPTTRDKQEEIASAKGGIVPPWNSPTGSAIDTSTGQQVPFATPVTPEGWLNRAIAAAKSGDTLYDTGGAGSNVDLNYRQAQISQGPLPTDRTTIGTPSGGSIGLGSNLYNAMDKSRTPAQADTERAQRLADQFQTGST